MQQYMMISVQLVSNCVVFEQACTHSEKERRAMAVALKLEEERKAGENARLAKAEQHRAAQQQQKQIAQEVSFSHPAVCCSDL